MNNDGGLYLFCVAKGRENEKLPWKGIGDSEVFTLPYKDFIAIAQRCEPKAFVSENKEIMKAWLLDHERVVDEAWRHFGTIIPCRFNTIIIPTPQKSAQENFIEWMEKEMAHLGTSLDRLKDKAEYGVQIMWNREMILETIAHDDPEILMLRKEIQAKPEGIAYLMEKKIERLLKEKLEAKADTYFKTFYHKISAHVEAIHVEKVRTEEAPLQMILNVSCLKEKTAVKELGDTLETIAAMPGFEVRFTGPWPPYSFVNS
jgi:hypothetical protein